MNPRTNPVPRHHAACQRGAVFTMLDAVSAMTVVLNISTLASSVVAEEVASRRDVWFWTCHHAGKQRGGPDRGSRFGHGYWSARKFLPSSSHDHQQRRPTHRRESATGAPFPADPRLLRDVPVGCRAGDLRCGRIAIGAPDPGVLGRVFPPFAASGSGSRLLCGTGLLLSDFPFAASGPVRSRKGQTHAVRRQPQAARLCPPQLP